ncbi:DUF5592 family protein [Cytobacillus kochii]|uniref:DUF5592 family protein n=1 Tax=Cytobacillus kochii TaxID=859143 RepID=UPI001CD3476C|nr:DUF5592 family protein [Cytobacillus kochii]MCA1028836.1 DUF5592 family protein [Cytobacillus kochii]
MRRSVRVPEEISADPKWAKLTVLDGLIIISSIAIGYFTKWIVHPYLEIFYVGFFPIALFVLLLPSTVPHKKNFQTALTVFRKDRKVYKSISLEDIDLERGQEDGI